MSTLAESNLRKLRKYYFRIMFVICCLRIFWYQYFEENSYACLFFFFRFSDQLPEGNVFIGMCFLIRIVSAIGTSFSQTAILAILSVTFKEKLSTVFVSKMHYYHTKLDDSVITFFIRWTKSKKNNNIWQSWTRNNDFQFQTF